MSPAKVCAKEERKEFEPRPHMVESYKVGIVFGECKGQGTGRLDCVCVCACVHMYLCACAYIFVRARICAHVSLCVHACVRKQDIYLIDPLGDVRGAREPYKVLWISFP